MPRTCADTSCKIYHRHHRPRDDTTYVKTDRALRLSQRPKRLGRRCGRFGHPQRPHAVPISGYAPPPADAPVQPPNTYEHPSQRSSARGRPQTHPPPPTTDRAPTGASTPRASHTRRSAFARNARRSAPPRLRARRHTDRSITQAHHHLRAASTRARARTRSARAPPRVLVPSSSASRVRPTVRLDTHRATRPATRHRQPHPVKSPLLLPPPRAAPRASDRALVVSLSRL